MEALAGTYRILAGARIYAVDFTRALQRHRTKAARKALDDLKLKTKAFNDNLGAFENRAVAAKIRAVQHAWIDSNDAADDLLRYLSSPQAGRRKARRLATRWVRAGSTVNRELSALPDRLDPYLSGEQREQLDASADQQ
jgi:hypothetical protein